jgi:hypothetical protein
MSFFKASKKAEDIKQGGSAHINSSGVYPVNIIVPTVSVSKGGSTSVDLFVEHEGQKQMIYGNLRITNNDGSPNKIGAKIFNQLLIIAGMDSVDDPVEAELPIGKEGAMKTVDVLEDLADTEVYMRIQMEYGKWNGDIKEKKVVKGFFRAEDKATAEEIVNNSDTVGKGYAREEKYFSNITYKDEVTPEEVAEWIKAGRPSGTASKSSSTDEPRKKAPAFGKKKRFGQKVEETTEE